MFLSFLDTEDPLLPEFKGNTKAKVYRPQSEKGK